jgi:hypothetical protein
VAGQQNAALLSQLESVSGQLLDVSGRNAALDSSSQQLDVSNTSFRSLNEDEANNAQLMSIIKYLRKEKEIMGGRLEVAEAEIVRTGQQLEQANKMAADAVQALEMERWVPYRHLPCQCCGSGFNKSGYGSGSSIASESGSGSGSRILIIKN